MSTDTIIDSGTATVAEPQTREIDLIGLDGSKAGTVELPGQIFDVQVNIPLIHQVVVAQLAAARQGTHSTKRRGEVRGGGRKPYRQKGTGRARQGSTRAPQFVGGGVVHGPKPRDYSQRTPKKMKAAALRGALSDRARNGRIHVVTALLDGDAPSTKSAITILSGLSERKHVLVVAQRSDELTWQSLRNATTVHLLPPDQLNTYDVLVSDDVVFTQAALEEFLAGPSKGRTVTASASESEADAATETEAATEGSDK
jgi:large subunit ribosomal protein L4